MRSRHVHGIQICFATLPRQIVDHRSWVKADRLRCACKRYPEWLQYTFQVPHGEIPKGLGVFRVPAIQVHSFDSIHQRAVDYDRRARYRFSAYGITEHHPGSPRLDKFKIHSNDVRDHALAQIKELTDKMAQQNELHANAMQKLGQEKAAELTRHASSEGLLANLVNHHRSQ
jgi:hypothetical protein